MPPSIESLITRIQKREPELRALVEGTFQPHNLREKQDTLLHRYPDSENRPRLFCVPVGIKDIYRVDGFPTQCGSSLPAGLFTGTEASCVSALKLAGAIVVAKTVTAEFAGVAPGPTRNPINPRHSPGGSSSGSAAGVAAGYFPAAMGTQTIGSIIRPAAYCGILGFKPSFGRIPTDGIIPFSPSADHVGVFCRDLKLLDDLLSVLVPDWNQTGTESALTLGIPTGPYMKQASERALSQFESTLAGLSQTEISIKRVPLLANISQINDDHWRLICGEVVRVHRDWSTTYEKLYRPQTRKYFATGVEVSEEDLMQLRSNQAAVRRDIQAIMDREKINAWVCPSATGTAPEGLETTGDPCMNLPWTHAGLPALSMPAGQDERGLPYGLQIVGRFQNDEHLMELARTVAPLLT